MNEVQDAIALLGADYALEWRIFLVVLLTAVAHQLLRRGVARLARRVETTANYYDDAFCTAVGKPLGWFVWLLGLSFATRLLADVAPGDFFDQLHLLRDVGVIVLLAWFAVRFIGQIEAHHLATDSDGRLDAATTRAISKILRVSVMITAALLGMQALDFSVSGLLAFGGIGGIAIGFAARDLLANFFGALMIFLDRPFAIGDWIRSPDRNIEGTVEEIGWRQTRIRTFDQRPLYVPNALFGTLAVENPSRMHNRRIYETIGLRYDDMALMPAIVADVEAMLRAHPEIDQARTLMVNFVTFGPSSLDFFVYTFTRTTEWEKFHVIKQDVLFRIARIIADHGAEIAFPTRTLHLSEPSA